MCESSTIVWICYCTRVRVWENEKIDFSTHVNNHALVHILKLKMGFQHMSVFMYDYVGMAEHESIVFLCVCMQVWVIVDSLSVMDH